MSIECLNQALKVQWESQTPTKRLILILLANYCDDNKSCFPSYKHIAHLAGLKDPKHIASIIKEFEDLGFLKIEKRYKEDGGNISNRYHMTLDNPPTGVETTTPLVSTPPNTKEDTKEKTDKGLGILFEEFWTYYPRKVSKDYSKTQYVKAVKSYDEKQLIENVKAYAAEVKFQKTDPQFIPHCSTWISQKRYLDYNGKKVKTKRSLNAIAG